MNRQAFSEKTPRARRGFGIKRIFALGLIALGAIVARAANPDVVVAVDGSGKYKSIREAIDAAPQLVRDDGRRWTIFVKNGIYKELVYVQREKRFIRLVGEDAEKTVLMHELYASLPGPDEKPMGTFRTPTLVVDADDFAVENMTVENIAGPKGQALALRVDGDRVVFRRCHFLGWQDTIFANRGRQFFQECLIRGAVDFIFGGATTYFERCEIQCVGNGFITAASTPDNQKYGFVFSYCKIVGMTPEVRSYLGRPWRDYAQTIFLNTEMSDVVQPEGWDNWKKRGAEKTAVYAEFNSTGAGGANMPRAAWSKQLTAVEAANYSVENVLGGSDGWNPLKVPEPPAKKKKRKK